MNFQYVKFSVNVAEQIVVSIFSVTVTVFPDGSQCSFVLKSLAEFARSLDAHPLRFIKL